MCLLAVATVDANSSLLTTQLNGQLAPLLGEHLTSGLTHRFVMHESEFMQPLS